MNPPIVFRRCSGPAPLFLLAGAFVGWFIASDAYPVLDRHPARLAGFTSTGLAHRHLLNSGYFPL